MAVRRCGGVLGGRWRRLARDRDRGFSTLEAVITIPIVVILTMIVVQFVMVWHARNVAEAAARDGLRAARGYDATAQQGQDAAEGYLSTVAARMLPDRRVEVTRSQDTVEVAVHAKVASVIPFGSFSVDESASGPVERFVEIPPEFANSGAGG